MVGTKNKLTSFLSARDQRNSDNSETENLSLFFHTLVKNHTVNMTTQHTEHAHVSVWCCLIACKHAKNAEFNCVIAACIENKVSNTSNPLSMSD